MTTAYEVPLSPEAQTFRVPLGGATYQLTFVWNVSAMCWVMDLADADGEPLAQGIPLVTGLDLLAQYRHLVVGGSLVVQTAFSPDEMPTYENLGREAHLFFVTEP